MPYSAKSDKITVTLTANEAAHLLYGLNSVWVGKADKETMLPEDYSERLRLQRSIVKKFSKAGIEKRDE